MLGFAISFSDKVHEFFLLFSLVKLLFRRMKEITSGEMQSVAPLVTDIEKLFICDAGETKKYLDGRMLLRVFEGRDFTLPKEFISLDGVSSKWAEVMNFFFYYSF